MRYHACHKTVRYGIKVLRQECTCLGFASGRVDPCAIFQKHGMIRHECKWRDGDTAVHQGKYIFDEQKCTKCTCREAWQMLKPVQHNSRTQTNIGTQKQTKVHKHTYTHTSPPSLFSSKRVCISSSQSSAYPSFLSHASCACNMR